MENNKNGFLILVVLLALGLIGAGVWGFQQHSQNQSLSAEKEELSQQLSGLSDLKSDLQKEVDSLQVSYQLLASDNQQLQGSLADVQSALARKDAEIKAVKANRLGEVNGLKGEIQQLLAAKAELENSIAAVKAENDSLRTRTGVLERDITIAKGENAALSNLNKTIQGELKRLTLANFKATAFRVEVEGKKPKATVKSGRARRVIVTCDLTDVPQEYQGLRPLYLTITDDKGTPVSGSNIQAKVNVNSQVVDLIAVKEKNVNITASQRLSFSHDLGEKLREGYYRVAVYTDIGLLGAASFRLE
jgi:peptidoglycan hydrolase CwlO-like protein